MDCVRQAKYKFQRLKVYHLALDYVDGTYQMARELPGAERFNLCSQLERASTSIVLNIAEGSTGQSDAEQNRFLRLALRSYRETIACLNIMRRPMKKRCRILPAGGLGVSPSFKKAPKIGGLWGLIETISAVLIEMRSHITDNTLAATRELGHELFIKLQSFRKALRSPFASSRSSVSHTQLPANCERI